VQVVTVVDTVQPTLSLTPTKVTVQCHLVPPAPTVTATDNCDDDVPVVYAEMRVDGTCEDRYKLFRTWTATDDCGNTREWTQEVTVIDTVAPTLTVPADDTIECTESDQPANTGSATATDNCDPAPAIAFSDATAPGTCPQERTITRTWTATDRCGNSTTGVQVVTVVDTTAPVQTVPPDVTIECTESDQPGNTGSATATDNCDADVVPVFGDSVEAGTCPQERTITRTWTATDDCGNVSTGVQVITVVDTTAPALLGVPADTTVNCEVVPPPATPTSTDNCDPAPVITFDEVSTIKTCVYTYTLTRTWTATDACGNSTTGVQVVTVVDRTEPIITVPADTTIECDASSDPSSTGSAAATDNCDPAPVITYGDQITPGSCPNEWTITRTWRATDICTNFSEGVQVITVIDTKPPDMAVPADVTIQCHESDQPGNTGAATAVDTCDPSVVPTFEDVVTPGACPDARTITRTWKAEDDCGNVTTGVQVITVIDTIAPVLTVPPDAVRECTQPTDPASTGTATARDNCDDTPTVTYSDVITPGPVAGCDDSYVITRTWRAEDDCSNVSTRAQTILVQDTTPPTVTPGSSDLYCLWPPNHDYHCFEQGDFNPTITDNCSSRSEITWRFTGCQSDQADNAPGVGDGDTINDCVVDADGLGFRVRSERNGNDKKKKGRRYAVTIAGTDECGNVSGSTRIGYIYVPHSTDAGCLYPNGCL
jgi:hypothetical protein